MPKNVQITAKLQARFQLHTNREIPDVQAGFRKGRGTRDNLPTSIGSLKKQKSSRKASISALLTMPKPMTVWITTNFRKFWKMGIPDHLTCLLRNLYAGQEATVRTGHGTTDFSRSIKAVYCHPAYLTYMESTSWETLGWMKHKLESRLPGEISITSDMQMTLSYGRNWIRTKEPLDEGERGEWKNWLNTQHSKN